MTAETSTLPQFLALSSELTGFNAFQLQGTGMADAYLATVINVVGRPTVEQLLQAFGEVRTQAAADGAAPEALLRARILSDDLLGPIARNIIKMWYVGTWYQLPAEWREAFGNSDADTTFVVSPVAYTEGLLWPAIGANPPGAKAPGYGTWAQPPRIPDA